MTVFIADHLGAMHEQSPTFRPIHIGAALVDPAERGPEPDIVAPHSISAQTAYADLRMLHHIRHVYEGACANVAIMQYRRMFLIGDAKRSDPSLERLHKEDAASDIEFAATPLALRASYVAHLKNLDPSALPRLLEGCDFIANKVGFVGRSVQTQYIGSIKLDYPDQPEYVEAWMTLRRLLELRLGDSLVGEYLDGGFGYMNNCFISSWRCFADYCEFLFDILGLLEAYRDVYRLYGYLAERIFAVYLAHRDMVVKSRRLMFFD